LASARTYIQYVCTHVCRSMRGYPCSTLEDYHGDGLCRMVYSPTEQDRQEGHPAGIPILSPGWPSGWGYCKIATEMREVVGA